MSNSKKALQRTKRRGLRVRGSLNSTILHRISIFRSAKHIYAQLIDDKTHNTVASCSSLEMKDLKGNKQEKAGAIGQELARRALEKGVEKACFDRGSFLYHGRVKALAEGIRQGGLKV